MRADWLAGREARRSLCRDGDMATNCCLTIALAAWRLCMKTQGRKTIRAKGPM